MLCSVCYNETESDPCVICRDSQRNQRKICVVELPKDVRAIEQIGTYDGRYHVLHGVIQPLEGITPDKLRIPELLRRVKLGEADEVFIATNPNMEGEATAMYLARQLAPLGLQVTRLALG